MVKGVKMNNKGFSLVETIVAVTILTLVAVPLMNSFSGAVVVVRNSSDTQRTLALAQSITEGVKTHSIIDLDKTFVYENEYYFDILDENFFNWDSYGKFTRENDNSFSDNDIYETNARQYYYGITGVNNGAKDYDALITLDSNRYNDINSRLIPKIVDMGSEGTTVIDNTGRLCNTVLDGEDDLGKMATDKLGGPSAKENMFCVMNVYVSRKNGAGEGAFGQGSSKSDACFVYADVIYSTGDNENAIDSNGQFVPNGDYVKYEYVGAKAFDSSNSLKYMYVICNSAYTCKQNYINFIFEKEDSYDEMNMTIALVVSRGNNEGKWKITAKDTSYSVGHYRDEVQFVANNVTQDNIINMYSFNVDPPGTGSEPSESGEERINNLGTTGMKERRLYNLKVDIFDHQSSASSRFSGEPIVTMNSTFVR